MMGSIPRLNAVALMVVLMQRLYHRKFRKEEVFSAKYVDFKPTIAESFDVAIH
jgi:hypothetical protein